MWGGYKRENVNLSILNFNCRFNQFCESFHPLRIRVCAPVWEAETVKKGYGTANLRATFQQNGEDVAVIEMDGQMSSPSVFQRMRRFKSSQDQIFFPLQEATQICLYILGQENTLITQTKIHFMSIGGVYVEDSQVHSIGEPTGSLNFLLIINDKEAFSGIGRIDHVNEHIINKSSYYKFTFESAKKEDLKILSTFLKWYCCSVEDVKSLPRKKHAEPKSLFPIK